MTPDRYEEKARKVFRFIEEHCITCSADKCREPAIESIAQALREEAEEAMKKEALNCNKHCDKARMEQREIDARIADYHSNVNQELIEKAKNLMIEDGAQFHQQHIWEFQALRDEGRRIATAIREAGENKNGK